MIKVINARKIIIGVTSHWRHANIGDPEIQGQSYYPEI